MKLKLLLLLFSITTNLVIAQTTFLDKIETAPTLVPMITVDSDGSFLIANSFKEDINQSQYDGIQIIKYDDCESIVFAKNFTVPNHNLWLADFIQGSDGFYYLVGTFYYPSNNRDFFLLKLNPDGSKNSFKVFGSPFLDVAYSIQETPEGNFMIFGNTEHLPNDNRNFYLVVDNQANIQSGKLYFNAPIWGRAIACSDGGFLGRMGRLIYKVAANGEIEWANNFNGISSSSPFVEVRMDTLLFLFVVVR